MERNITSLIRSIDYSMKKSYLTFILSSFFAFTSCTSRKEVLINSNPPGASVYQGNIKLGETPTKAQLEFYRSSPIRTLKVMKDGFEDTTLLLTYRPKDEITYHVDLRKKEIVFISIVDFEPVSVGGQSKLQKITRKTLAYLETIERSSSVKTVQRITNNVDTTFNISGPVLSPDGGSVLYTIYETINDRGKKFEKSNIYLQSTQSKAVTSITKGNQIDLFPAFSPDGDYIYFSSNRTGIPLIWKVRRAGGGGITSITSSLAEDIQPSPSPDGKNLAYASNLPSATDPQIWTVSNSGTLPTQLREGESPCISPDGSKIVFARIDRSHAYTRNGQVVNPRQIWVMGFDGSGETQITQNIDYDISSPRWSSDGKWIIYSSDKGQDNNGRNNFDIWTIDSDGTHETQLTTNGSVDDYPYWGADGFVYFRSNRGGFWNIWRVIPILPD